MSGDVNTELIAFAEEVRCAALAIAGASGAQRLDLVTERALALCTRAAAVKEGEAMRAESAADDDGRYALAGLSVNLGARAPEIAED